MAANYRKPGTISASKNSKTNKFTGLASQKKLVKASEQPLKGLFKKKKGK